MKKTITGKILCVLLAFVLFSGGVCFGCTKKEQDNDDKTSGKTAAADGDEVEIEDGTHPQVRFTVQIEGEDPFDFTMELYPEYAPITCRNFLKLVNSGFYNDKTFHRIIDGFMAQGGDPKGDGTGSTTPIKGEFAANGVNNPISHVRGVVSMARRSNNYNSGSCQFFICFSDQYTGTLDGQYAAFGKVIDGMDRLDALQAIEKVRNGEQSPSKPVKKVVIRTAETLTDASEVSSQRSEKGRVE